LANSKEVRLQILDAAEKVFKEQQRPIHYKELGPLVKSDGGFEPNPAMKTDLSDLVYSYIYHDVKKATAETPTRFQFLGKGLFALQGLAITGEMLAKASPSASAQKPPKAPVGKRWVLVPEEFDIDAALSAWTPPASVDLVAVTLRHADEAAAAAEPPVAAVLVPAPPRSPKTAPTPPKPSAETVVPTKVAPKRKGLGQMVTAKTAAAARGGDQS